MTPSIKKKSVSKLLKATLYGFLMILTLQSVLYLCMHEKNFFFLITNPLYKGLSTWFYMISFLFGVSCYWLFKRPKKDDGD